MKKSVTRKGMKKSKMAKCMAHKMEKVMGEYKMHNLKSGSGHKVSKRKQAIAIGLSEARKKC
jgi:hypothetical protein